MLIECRKTWPLTHISLHFVDMQYNMYFWHSNGMLQVRVPQIIWWIQLWLVLILLMSLDTGLDYKRSISNNFSLDFAINKKFMQARHCTKSQDKIIHAICPMWSQVQMSLQLSATFDLKRVTNLTDHTHSNKRPV